MFSVFFLEDFVTPVVSVIPVASAVCFVSVIPAYAGIHVPHFRYLDPGLQYLRDDRYQEEFPSSLHSPNFPLLRHLTLSKNRAHHAFARFLWRHSILFHVEQMAQSEKYQVSPFVYL